jgi:glycosyltransferase involved in cell wall biosynthesis
VSGRRLLVALVGPPSSVANASYGAGAGGYVRNMQVYLSMADCAGVEYVPCHTTVRQLGDTRLGLVGRFFRDVSAFRRIVRNVDVVHVMGQYRGAISREWAFAWLAGFLGVPMVYEIKAGAFVPWFGTCSRAARSLAAGVLRRSARVLCEGIPVVGFLRERLGIDAEHLPNVVPAREVPPEVPTRLQAGPVKVLFTGYCYESKGVFDLAKGFEAACASGLPVQLTFVGAEDPAFTAFLDAMMASNPGLVIRRLGVMPHDAVLREMLSNDVFCMPTYHPGEGHTNSVNEALMTGMVVMCTDHGFLPSILAGDAALFVGKRDPASIANAIAWVASHRAEARAMAARGRELLLGKYVAEPWFRKLGETYRALARIP